MRTRRSWRNQNRLWKELGKELGEETAPPEKLKPLTAEQVQAMFWLSKTSRNLLLKEIKKRESQ